MLPEPRGGDEERVQLLYLLGNLAPVYSEFWCTAASLERRRVPLEMRVELHLHLAKCKTSLANATGYLNGQELQCPGFLQVLPKPRFALRVLITLMKSGRTFVRVGPGSLFQFSFNMALSFWLKPFQL